MCSWRRPLLSTPPRRQLRARTWPAHRLQNAGAWRGSRQDTHVRADSKRHETLCQPCAEPACIRARDSKPKTASSMKQGGRHKLPRLHRFSCGGAVAPLHCEEDARTAQPTRRALGQVRAHSDGPSGAVKLALYLVFWKLSTMESGCLNRSDMAAPQHSSADPLWQSKTKATAAMQAGARQTAGAVE